MLHRASRGFLWIENELHVAIPGLDYPITRHDHCGYSCRDTQNFVCDPLRFVASCPAAHAWCLQCMVHYSYGARWPLELLTL